MPIWPRPATLHKALYGLIEKLTLPLTNGNCHSILPFMDRTVTIDGAGRIVIPKRMRDDLGLQAGDTLSLQTDGDQVTLRPVRPKSRMRKEHGIWVFFGGDRPIKAEETDRVLEELREARDMSLFGIKP